MSSNYLLADVLTRIRNGQRAALASVRCQASRFVARVLDVLRDEGYIHGYEREEVAPGKAEFRIDLKYHEGEAAIKELSVVSKPSRRVYAEARKVPRVHNGLGVAIISTNEGVLADHIARDKVGGEVLCYVF